MVDFTIKQLEIFVSIVEHGSFTSAAEELFLNQSTVSSHLISLEETLGRPLFTRTNRRQISLTHDGELLYPIAKKVLETCEKIPPIFQSNTFEKPLVLGASMVPRQYLLPEQLSAYLSSHRDFRYVLRKGDSEDIHRMLKNGEIRIGFVGAISEPDMVEYVPISTDRLVLVAPNTPKYQAMQEKGCYGRDLLTEPMVAREDGSGTERSLQGYMRGLGMSPEKRNIVARMDDPEAIKRTVIGSPVVSVLSNLAVEQEVQNGSLLSFEMDRTGLKRSIYLVTLRGSRLNVQEQAFVDFLLKRIKKQ